MADENKAARFSDAHPMPARLSAPMRALSRDLQECPVGKSFFWSRGDGIQTRSGQVTSRIRDMKLAGDLDESTTFVTQRAAKGDVVGVRVWKATT